MGGYSKGYKGENELGSLFEDRDYVWIRVAGSGSANRELPDILVMKDGHYVALEVKRWSHKDGDGNENKYEYVSKEEVEDLEYFSKISGCDYFIGYRFDYGDWKFVKKEEMKENEKSFRCEKDLNGRSLSDICQ